MTEQHPMIVAMVKAMADIDRAERGWAPIAYLSELTEEGQYNYFGYARAALTALLEPTHDMVEAGGIKCMMTGAWGYNADDDLRRRFTAMIQHILADPQGAGQTTSATTKGER